MAGGRGIVIVGALMCLALTGCAKESNALTLVQTKSPVQLLRNDAWSRLPDIMINDAAETTDVSTACLDPSVDPEGILRSWSSRTVALVNNSFAARVDTIADELANTFVDQGWVVSPPDDADPARIDLEKPGSLTLIAIEAVAKGDGHRASIDITVSGPCVKTAGADSDEVTALEVASNSGNASH